MENTEAGVIEEIRQIKIQYKAEVTGHGRAWPKAIKSRVMRLSDMGMRVPDIAEKTGISFHTISAWKTAHMKRSTFHQLPVVVDSPVKAKRKSSVAIAATEHQRRIESNNNAVTVTVTTPEGYLVRLESIEAAAAMILQLRKA